MDVLDVCKYLEHIFMYITTHSSLLKLVWTNIILMSTFYFMTIRKKNFLIARIVLPVYLGITAFGSLQ